MVCCTLVVVCVFLTDVYYTVYLLEVVAVCMYIYMLCVWSESVGLICVQFYM